MRISLILASLVGASTLSFAAQAPHELPIIVDGPITVDGRDIEAYMLRVPEIHRAQVRSSVDRLASMADNVFIARNLAQRAKKDGMDRDPAVQRRMAQLSEALLADLYIARMDKQVEDLNLDARARELFNGEPSKYEKPAQVHVQYIMVGLYGRTREMARDLARKIYEEARSGKEEFLTLAARHSDDPDKTRHGGDLGLRLASGVPEPVRERVESMSRKGEISEPIESATGFHIVRFIERRAAEPVRFEQVKGAIIKAERERIAKERHEALLREIRSSSTVTVFRNNLEALAIPADAALAGKNAPAK